jgi:hypothetical protein
MSFGTQIAGLFGKLTAAVGGGPVLGVLVVAGLVVGGLAGGFAGQPKPAGTSSSVLDIYPCWKVGTAFAKAPPGQKVWVTGKNADGSWYRVYTGSPTHPEGWVHANLITLADAASVQIVDCAPITALVVGGSPFETITPIQDNSPSPGPTPVPTATPSPTPSPTPKPTPKPTPRPTPKPTPKPTPVPHEHDAPVIAAIRLFSPTNGVVMRPGQTCGLPTSQSVLAVIQDASTITAKLYYTPTGLPEQAPITMTFQAAAGAYVGTINTSANWPAIGPVTFRVVADDKWGNGPTQGTGKFTLEC